MQTPTRAELLTYAVAMAFVALVHVLPWMSAACDQAAWKDIMKTAGPSCAEFWVNRYQTAWAGLIGAFAAMTAAWIAWHSIQVQIGREERSFAEAARRTADLEIMQIDREIAMLGIICDRTREFADEFTGVFRQGKIAEYHALDRVSLPQTTSIIVNVGSKASNDYIEWAHRLMDYRGKAQMQSSRATGPGSVGEVARSQLRQLDSQISLAVRESIGIIEAANVEIAALESKKRLIAAVG